MQVKANSWSESFSIRSYEVDPAGYASVQTICNLLQEAASNHAQHLGTSIESLEAHSLIWVLSRLHIEVHSYPGWRDVVRVQTWPSGTQGIFATREFLVYNEQDELLVRGTSAWLLLHTERRKPVRPPAFILGVLAGNEERALDDSFPRFALAFDPLEARRFTVRYSDLDVNGHVNNVRYIDWAVESVPQELFKNRRIAELEVVFRAETLYGDTVVAQSGAPDDSRDVFFHRVTREGDGREVAALRSVWSQTNKEQRR